jgi:serine protease Do
MRRNANSHYAIAAASAMVSLLFIAVPQARAAAAAPAKPVAKQDVKTLYDNLKPITVTIYVEGPGFKSGGSGVILHEAGFIATSAHVVEKGLHIFVEFATGSPELAQIVTLSRTEDLALLKVGKIPAGIKVPRLADSDKLAVGDDVFALGAPLGLKYTLTTGIISALRTNFEADNPLSVYPKNVIQTDAALNRGNSGGGLFNSAGEEVGIISFISSPTGGSVGLGFAVPSNVVRNRLFENPLPYIGLGLRRVPKPLAEALHWPVNDALLIEQVQPDSPAEGADLRGGLFDAQIGLATVSLGGDLIVKVGQFTTDKIKEIDGLLRSLKPGDKIPYTILRAGREQVVQVVVPEIIPVPPLPQNK